jgi:hypothetical protein
VVDPLDRSPPGLRRIAGAGLPEQSGRQTVVREPYDIIAENGRLPKQLGELGQPPERFAVLALLSER